MSPRPNVTEERKSQILNAAEQVFTKKGFDEARMDDIAEETGVSKGTLYLYFKSKDDLIFAILDRIFQREFKQLQTLKLEETGAAEAIWKLTDLLTSDLLGLLHLVPIIYSFLALAFRNRHVQRALKNYVNRYINILIPIIQRGIRFGRVSPGGCEGSGDRMRCNDRRHTAVMGLRSRPYRARTAHPLRDETVARGRAGALNLSTALFLSR